MRSPLFFLLFLLALSLLPLAQATSYVQPMLSRDWEKHTLLVSIPLSPSSYYPVIKKSLDVWNQAQKWFVESWFPTHPNAIFTLQPTSGPGADITIQYVQNAKQSWTSANGRTISIVLGQASHLFTVTNHELGHALGLDHTSVSDDLMNGKELSSSPYPSTLNLYGVYLEAAGSTFAYGDVVTLLSQIPYTEWFPGILPIPEYPAPALFGTVVLFAVLLLVKRSRFNASF